MNTIRGLFHLSLCLTLLTLRSPAATYYVNAANLSPTPPFGSWDTAATNIQDAIDLTTNGDTVLVTNGVYAYGGLVMVGDLMDRVALTNAITVESINGPWVTTILGAGAVNGTNAVRCAWLTNGATLAGFTLTGGATRNAGDTDSLESGGGVWCASSNAFVANCVIVSNTAYEYGGGTYQGTVNACLVNANSNHLSSGGAAYQTVMNNCTIVSNADCGVSSPLALTNCIIYFNGNGNCNGGRAFSYCCSVPALSGSGNFTNAPLLLADGAHQATNSPCIGAGTGIPGGTDIFGNTWSNPPSIGCAEWSPVPAFASAPTVQFPFTGGIAISVQVAGQPPFLCWWFKDGSLVQADADHTNVNTTALLINSFAVSDAGSYQVVVSNAFGMITSAVAQVSAHCVAPIGGAVPPYSDWASAATNIQDAINAAQAGDIVLVTNGLYTGGGLVMAGGLTNRVALNLPVMVQSVNGPWVTTIQGGNKTNGAPIARCAWLTNGASLVGFTLEGGAATGTGGTPVTSQSGGGVWCASSNALVANCLIHSNVANGYGGGAYSGTLVNCAVYNNNGVNVFGGGTGYSCLNHCTIIANAGYTGGCYGGAGTNCILYYNSNANFSVPSSLSYCCTYPLPSSGVGNFTNPPGLFVDFVHLLTNAPCLGAGTNLGAVFDIAGQPWGNPPSVGCAELTDVPLVGSPGVTLTNNPAGFVISAAATGAGPCTIWWLENGVAITNDSQFSDTQTASLLIAASSLADAGAYQLVVSNAYGVVTSAVVQVTMHCVNANGTNPVPPYQTWAAAATNIQDAITAAAVGEVVLVTNGLYASGGISMDGNITNRVSVNKAILVESVNGAGATIIQGAWDSSSTNGPGAIRCAWLTTNAILSGFTLREGATRNVYNGGDLNGGGILGPTSATVVDCLICNNAAAQNGGGAYGLTLIDCTLCTNTAQGISGGQAYGGGAYNCRLQNCRLSHNFALAGGGGAGYSFLTNCAVTANTAVTEGGGVYYGTLINCTLTQNQSSSTTYDYGGGANDATLINSIIYGNDEANSNGTHSNFYNCTLTYCCTAPLATGNGNLATNPQLLADGIHLSSNSPCIGAGTAATVSGTDIDGQPWNNPPSIGCDEWQPAPVITTQPTFQVGVPPHGLTTTMVVAGAPANYFWTQNGAPIEDDGHYTNSATTSLTINNFGPDDAGAYQVVVTNAYGAVTSAVVDVVIHAVNAAGSNLEPPFSSWATAATNIQDAVDISSAGDIILVTNGIYAYGGVAISGGLTNRVATTNAITVISANGCGVTTIQGAWDTTTTNGPGAIRCAYVADGAVLNGFTLCNGATLATGEYYPGGPLESGGAIYCTSVNGRAVDCILSNNAAVWGAGLANGTLNNSLVVLNQARTYGGGACYGTLNNCTVIDSSAGVSAGGTWNSTVRNSIVLYNYYGSIRNLDAFNSNYGYSSTFPNYTFTCTSPLPTGTGNIDADPQFLDLYHIPTSSPCVGAGSAAYATGYDLDGEAWNTPPSMGCSEVVLGNLTGPLSVSIQSLSTNVLVNREGFYSARITGRAAWGQWSFGDDVTVSNTGNGAIHAWTNAGNYTVTYTAFNNDYPQGVTGSLPVVVVQPALPQLQIAMLTTNGIQFEFAGQFSVNYTVQYATNLVPPVTWQTLQTIAGYYDGTLKITDPAITNGARFYRVLAQ
jgi:hypothetical protein